jgi:hypothetical protein
MDESGGSWAGGLASTDWNYGDLRLTTPSRFPTIPKRQEGVSGFVPQVS